METLPLELIEYISKIDNKTWYLLVQVYRFLYEKTLNSNYMNELKRKFLLCSTISPDVNYNKEVTYKYNKKFHLTFFEVIQNTRQNYEVVYYLPNGDLHTFEDPCIACYNSLHELHIWFKNNKIHRDDDKPALIHVYTQSPTIQLPYLTNNELYLSSVIILNHIIHLFPQYYTLDNIQMWFTNGLPHRDNGLPAVIKQYVD